MAKRAASKAADSKEQLTIGSGAHRSNLGMVDDGKVILRQIEHCIRAVHTLWSSIRSRGVKLAAECPWGVLRAIGYAEQKDEDGDTYYRGVIIKFDIDLADANARAVVQTEFFESYHPQSLFVGTDPNTVSWDGPYFVPPVGSYEVRDGASLWRLLDEETEEVVELDEFEAMSHVVAELGLE